MTYTKQEVVPVDWLSAIEGLRVVDAVAYLKTFDQSLTLQPPELDNAYDVVKESAHLLQTVPMTREEAIEAHRAPLVKLLKQCGKDERRFSDAGDTLRARKALERSNYFQKRIDYFDKNLDANIKVQP